MKNARVLFISYNAVTDSVAQSQVIPYLEKLSKRGVDISFLSFEKKDPKEDFFIGETRNRLSKSGIDWHTLRYHKRPSLPATIYDIFQGVIYTFYLLHKYNFEVIHARMIVPAAICLVLRRFKTFKWLYDMRGLVAEEYVGHGSWKKNGVKFRLVKFVEKLCLLNADFISVLTYKQKNFISNSGYLKNKNLNVDIVPCCVDIDRFRLEPGKNSAIAKELKLEDKFVLIYLGSLGTCYLLPEMIDYFLCLRRSFKNAFFLFVTNGKSQIILKETDRMGLEKEDFNIISVPFDKVPEVLSLCDVGIYFINPYDKFGSFPIKLSEYLACGLPVVINRGIGDSDDIVKRDNLGCVIEGFGADNYIKSIYQLNELLREKDNLRLRCRKVAENDFSLEMGSGKYHAIYSRLVK
ncbi:glycosyltransferase family 4 protein [Candidatus Omnitrophota bacterium]